MGVNEVLGLGIGAVTTLSALTLRRNEVVTSALSTPRAAQGFKGHQWLSVLLALLSSALILSIIAWVILGVRMTAELDPHLVVHQEDYRYAAPGPKSAFLFATPADGLDNPRTSRLLLKENGKPLGPAHSLHADIGTKGSGRYSHWDSWIVFSASDNSDPRKNGRTYEISYRVMPSTVALLLSLILTLALLSLRLTRGGFVAISAVVRHPLAFVLRPCCAVVVFLVVAWAVSGFPETRAVDGTSIQHHEGAAYVVAHPDRTAFVDLTGDRVGRRSGAALQVLENGTALGPASTSHAVIDKIGGGTFSHWGNVVVFSSSDNTDPRMNGRQYQLKYRTYPGPLAWLAAFIAIAILVAAPFKGTAALVAVDVSRTRVLVGLLFCGVFALALTQLGLRFLAEFNHPPNMQAPGFGSANAPYSDALLWIFGGLQFLLEGSDVSLTPNLYRPTIAIMFGSVMAVFNSAEAVPAFFFFSLLIVLVIAALASIGTRLPLMLGLWALLCVLLPDAPLWQAVVTVSMPDVPALLFSLCGLFLVLLFLSGRANLFVLCVGLFSLGIATAIRGALLPTGLVLVALCCWQRGWKDVGWLAVAGLASFLAPFLLDSFLQREYRTYNNALVGLYCVVHDATHFWTSECDAMYYQRGITAERAIRDYLGFATSLPGIRFLVWGAIERVRHDLATLSYPVFSVVLIMAALTNARWRDAARLNGTFPTVYKKVIVRPRSWWLSLFAAFISMWAAAAGFAGFATVLLLACALLAVVRRDFVAVGCFAVYASGVLMMAAIGAGPLFGVNTARITATYSFALPLGLIALVMGSDPPQGQRLLDRGMRWSRRLASAGVACIAFLYLAVWLWPSTWRSTFETEVIGRKAALKVLDSVAADRSGYYVYAPSVHSASGAGALIYTRRDNLPIGSVRRYESLRNDRAFITSFFEPNALLP